MHSVVTHDLHIKMMLKVLWDPMILKLCQNNIQRFS